MPACKTSENESAADATLRIYYSPPSLCRVSCCLHWRIVYVNVAKTSWARQQRLLLRSRPLGGRECRWRRRGVLFSSPCKTHHIFPSYLKDFSNFCKQRLRRTHTHNHRVSDTCTNTHHKGWVLFLDVLITDQRSTLWSSKQLERGGERGHWGAHSRSFWHIWSHLASKRTLCYLKITVKLQAATRSKTVHLCKHAAGGRGGSFAGKECNKRVILDDCEKTK